MKRTAKTLGMAVGAAALIALSSACTKRPSAPPAAPPSEQQPGVNQTPSDQPPPTGPTGQYGAPGEQPGYGSGVGPQQGPPGRGVYGPPEQPGTGAFGAGVPAQDNERALCDALANSALLHVEDVKDGVAIVLTPRSGSSISTVHDDARKLESSIHMGPSQEAQGEKCGIIETGRLPGVSTTIVGGSKSVRIVMTTNNPNEVKELRRSLRDDVKVFSTGSQEGSGGQR